MIKVVADNKIPFLQGALEKVARVEYIAGSKISREHLQDADALIVRTRTKCNQQLLENTGVKIIASATIGYDHIDTQYCDAQGIRWTNAPGCNSGSVKQYIASVLATISNITKKPFGQTTLGIVGVGNVGSKVEKMARTLGMKVLLNDPPRAQKEGPDHFTELNTLVAQSDIISMHVPLVRTGNYITFHMADEEFFSQMKPDAWFINSSRGEVVNTRSLFNTLQNQQIAGAILDVWEHEPELDINLMKLTRIATPHIAGYSADGKANGTAMSVQAISRFFHLGMDDWYPQSLPLPQQSTVEIINRHNSLESLFSAISLAAYNIEADSIKLKLSPQSFELQRETYPVRREPEGLWVKLSRENKRWKTLLEDLGYNIEDS